MRYRFVLQLDRSPDEDENCATADEVMTNELVIVAARDSEPALSSILEELGRVLAKELAHRGLCT